MFVLVTGGTGFVGSAVVRALQKHGYKALALVRDREKARGLEAAGAEIAIGDMWRPESYGPLVARVDAVIHAAQQVTSGRWTRRVIEAMHCSDALMTRTLAAACLNQGKRFIYSSGALTHGTRDDSWIDETQPARPCLLAQGHAEMVAELTDMHRRDGLALQIISPGFVYGPGGFLKVTMDMIRAGKYRIAGSGDNYWSVVEVDDLGEAYVLALERGRDGESYFLADDVPLRRKDVIHVVADALGLPRVGHAPNWVMGLVLGFPLIDAANASIRLRNDKVKRELGWQPRFKSLQECLPTLLEQWRALE